MLVDWAAVVIPPDLAPHGSIMVGGTRPPRPVLRGSVFVGKGPRARERAATRAGAPKQQPDRVHVSISTKRADTISLSGEGSGLTMPRERCGASVYQEEPGGGGRGERCAPGASASAADQNGGTVGEGRGVVGVEGRREAAATVTCGIAGQIGRRRSGRRAVQHWQLSPSTECRALRRAGVVASPIQSRWEVPPVRGAR